ncbi:MAG: hypothetical protein V4654_00670 [Bdellovibrionota bacterium]
MNRIQTIFSLVCFSGGVLLSCAPDRLTTARWSKNGDSVVTLPDPTAISKSINVGYQQLDFQIQDINGAELEGSYYKRIFDRKEDKFISYSWLEDVPLALQTEISLMKNQKSFVTRKFLKSAQLLEDPKLVVREKDLQVNWKIVTLDKDGNALATYLDKFLNVVEEQKLGSDFTNTTALLYPLGPLQSKVVQVVLKRVSEDGLLFSNWFKITPQSGVFARAEKNQFFYPQSDKRFEQVQVYFYLNQMADWFSDRFKFQLPFLLEVETSVGFPKQTNTAFYYNHKIRLGEGDGIVFSAMALDPTIVIHESLHAVIQSTSSLPYDGQGGSLNEAFADFFTASILQNPKLGEASYKKASFKRTIDNRLKKSDVNNGLYHDSGIVSGLFWQLSQEIGSENSERLAWNTLLRLNPGSNFETFKEELLDSLKEEDLNLQNKVLVILKSRGWLE